VLADPYARRPGTEPRSKAAQPEQAAERSSARDMAPTVGRHSSAMSGRQLAVHLSFERNDCTESQSGGCYPGTSGCDLGPYRSPRFYSSKPRSLRFCSECGFLNPVLCASYGSWL
jgi:hypothetical protein